jgi:hypothetical protein
VISLSLRRQAVAAMCDSIADRLKLAQRPTAIAAPPSEAPEYPAVAVQLDRFKLETYDDDEIQGDEEGPLVGARAILDWAPNIDIGGGAYVSRVGKIIGSGRIWVGARLPAQREAMESRITRIFFDDPSVPSRWLITIPNPLIEDYTLPFPWTVTAFLGDTEWTNEYVFSERLWAWLNYELEIELLVPREFPLIKQIALEFDVDHSQPFDENGVFDRDDGADSTIVTIE